MCGVLLQHNCMHNCMIAPALHTCRRSLLCCLLADVLRGQGLTITRASDSTPLTRKAVDCWAGSVGMSQVGGWMGPAGQACNQPCMWCTPAASATSWRPRHVALAPAGHARAACAAMRYMSKAHDNRTKPEQQHHVRLQGAAWLQRAATAEQPACGSAVCVWLLQADAGQRRMFCMPQPQLDTEQGVHINKRMHT